MCGICGMFYKEKGNIDSNLLKNMRALIEHRGPDQQDYYTDEHIGLGHRRLSIIDLPEKGKQPMHNKEGDVWPIFNGEIYNYKKIETNIKV